MPLSVEERNLLNDLHGRISTLEGKLPEDVKDLFVIEPPAPPTPDPAGPVVDTETRARVDALEKTLNLIAAHLGVTATPPAPPVPAEQPAEPVS